MRISDWSSDVCSSDLGGDGAPLPLSEICAGGGAGVYRGEDIRIGLCDGPREVSARAEPWRDLCADRGRDRLFAVEDARRVRAGLARRAGEARTRARGGVGFFWGGEEVGRGNV